MRTPPIGHSPRCSRARRQRRRVRAIRFMHRPRRDPRLNPPESHRRTTSYCKREALSRTLTCEAPLRFPINTGRGALKEEWAQRTGKRRSRPHRPRHTVDEYRRIFAAIDDPRVDPGFDWRSSSRPRAGPVRCSDAHARCSCCPRWRLTSTSRRRRALSVRSRSLVPRRSTVR